jgi:hypothetical protein
LGQLQTIPIRWLGRDCKGSVVVRWFSANYKAANLGLAVTSCWTFNLSCVRLAQYPHAPPLPS